MQTTDHMSSRDALFATTSALALASQTLRLLQTQMPREILQPMIADLDNAWNTLRWWRAERDLERLLSRSDWSHPAQALAQPYTAFEDLLHLCEQYLVQQNKTPADPVLIATRDKLSRAVELNRTAAARRAAMRRGETS